jgi:hypothetical protein
MKFNQLKITIKIKQIIIKYYIMYKRLFEKTQAFKNTLRDPKTRSEYIFKLLTSKKFLMFGLFSNLFGIVFLSFSFNDKFVDKSFTRFISRWAGRLGNVNVPEFMREGLYNLYMNIYNVNREEILDQNLKNYKNIKDFFIRQIDVSIFI